MIDSETRLLEILDWDEELLSELYEKTARFLTSCRINDRRQLELALVEHLHDDLGEEGSKIMFMIVDQNIRREMRIIEE